MLLGGDVSCKPALVCSMGSERRLFWAILYDEPQVPRVEDALLDVEMR